MSTPHPFEQASADERTISPVDALARHHDIGRELAERLTDAHLYGQYHPDLSPIGWHLGHCALVEHHWICERILGERADQALHALYFPELSDKQGRSQRLPERGELIAWTDHIHQRTCELLSSPPAVLSGHPLMRDNYLAHFLEQHYAQHQETIAYCLSAAARSVDHEGSDPGVHSPLQPASTGREAVTVTSGHYLIGTDEVRGYDNERPAHHVQLDGARLARYPVSNAEWLAFMMDGGYDDPTHWSEAGDAWRRSAGVQQPWTWLQTGPGVYLWNGPDGRSAIEPGSPVSGINHYEAEAFARWAGARLPHEFEWEAAARSGRLGAAGTVWEWCGNALAPYPGFRPFPYDGYSMPWFDGNHFVLRGGSRFTDGGLKRPSFRNFFEPHIRHQQAGLRLAWDLTQ